jgi:hypothetical protein
MVRKTSDSRDFSTRQQKVAVLIASGASIRSASKEVGISERSINKWMHDPAFSRLIAVHRDRMLGRTIGKLVRASVRAAAVIHKLMNACGEPGEGVRLRAALGAIEVMVKAREHGELAARLAALEQTVADRERQA